MSLGAGFAPAGFSVAGFGSSDQAIGPITTVLIDAADGKPKNARKIDQRTGQYVYNANGRVQGMSGIWQRVQLAIKTARGSSCLGQNFGLQRTAQIKTGNFAKKIEDDLRLALSDLTTQKLIAITQVTAVDASPDNPTGAYAVLYWVDLTSNTEQVSKV